MDNIQQSQTQYVNIPNHLVLGILTTIFCCLPFGIVSIFYAAQVNSAVTVGNIQAAQMYSQKAKYWGMLSLWIGLALNLIGFLAVIFANIAAMAVGTN